MKLQRSRCSIRDPATRRAEAERISKPLAWLTMRRRASRFQRGVSPCECRAIHTGSVVDWRARREAATTRLNFGYSSAIWSYLNWLDTSGAYHPQDGQ
jgi:hypothetical protein